MVLLRMIFDTLIVITAGLVLAGVIAWLFWTLFKLVRFPEAGPIVAVAAIAVVFHDRLRDSPLIQITLLFAVLIAALGTIEGGLWRSAHPRRP